MDIFDWNFLCNRHRHSKNIMYSSGHLPSSSSWTRMPISPSQHGPQSGLVGSPGWWLPQVAPVWGRRLPHVRWAEGRPRWPKSPLLTNVLGYWTKKKISISLLSPRPHLSLLSLLKGEAAFSHLFCPGTILLGVAHDGVQVPVAVKAWIEVQRNVVTIFA